MFFPDHDLFFRLARQTQQRAEEIQYHRDLNAPKIHVSELEAEAALYWALANHPLRNIDDWPELAARHVNQKRLELLIAVETQRECREHEELLRQPKSR
jgi:hypothetical protein